MSKSPLYQQSSNYDQFQCLGAGCEDNCCSGWQVSIDRTTYDKYRACSHPVLHPRFEKWIQIQPQSNNANTFATIVLDGSTCPFLSENLCSIQTELGEDHLSRTCATFPRIRNNVAGVVERSLDLSCPEAARLCLSDPTPASFDQIVPGPEECQDPGESSEIPHLFYWEIRSAILSLLQNRAFPVAKRLILAGHFCDKLDDLTARGNQSAIPQTLEGFTFGINTGLYADHLRTSSANAADQLSIVLELMTARMRLDFTPQRYLTQYREFVDGLQLRPGLSLQISGDRYAEACERRYLPFIATHEHMLEHYLVYYSYRMLFPFGPKPLEGSGDGQNTPGRFTRQYMQMASNFAIIRALMIGLAACYGSDFGDGRAIQIIQGSSKALDHCTTYPPQVLQILADKGITNCAGMSILTQDPRNDAPAVLGTPLLHRQRHHAIGAGQAPWWDDSGRR
jgi:lysine-N-methylase